MKFYTVDASTREAMERPESRIRIKADIDLLGNGQLTPIPEDRIREAVFTSRREAGGGVVNSGFILLDNSGKEYLPDAEENRETLRPGREVLISFSAGEDNRYVPRFRLYTDAKGFRRELSSCGEDRVLLVLEDLSASLRRTEEERDWTENEVFTYLTIADKSLPATSAIHRVAARGKLLPEDIDCVTIDAEIPYLKTTRSVWEELSDCARAYEAHLETPVEKKLVFADSPYQREPRDEEEVQYSLGNHNLFYLSSVDTLDEFRNDIRLKWNKTETKQRQRLWRYEDPPVAYAEDLSPEYPFRAAGAKREIENPDVEYTAPYTALGEDGRPRTVVHADLLDTREEVENAMTTSGPGLEISFYSTTRCPDRAVIGLLCTEDTTLRELAIWGRPIAVEPNFCCFLRNEESIARYGMRILNATGKYFSDSLYDGVPHYRLWTERTLARMARRRRRYLAKTNRGLFHARVGARIELSETKLGSGIMGKICVIEELMLRYRRNEAFVTRMRLIEE